MAADYRISAKPLMDGGELTGVAFQAESQSDYREWHTRNLGQFAMVFARVMPVHMARLLIAALKAGDAVVFPGAYAKAQFELGFAFEWSPVHFVAPPQFARVS